LEISIMPNRSVLTLLVVGALAAGVALGWFLAPAGTATTEVAGEEQPLYWVSPMNSNFKSDQPGTSPMGMDLVPVFASDLAAGGDEPGISISPVVQSNLGIRTERVEYGPLQRLVETIGFVQYDEDRLEQVHTRVEGWIERLVVRASGDPVEAGQVLFELYSPTLVNAQEELVAALGSGSTTLIRASRERLAALGMSANQIERLERTRDVRQRTAVYAGHSGVVAELRVREGEYLTPATDTMSIASLDEVWIVGEVFERQSAWVAVGQQVEVRFDAYPGEIWDGQVDYVYPELHQATRTLQVRVRIANLDGRLRPNMYARLTIHGTATEPTVHVPLEALIRGGQQDRIVLATPNGRFQSTRVTAGIEASGRVQIIDGLGPDETVVVSGQFLIDSESSLAGAERRAGVLDGDSVADGTPHAVPDPGTAPGMPMPMPADDTADDDAQGMEAMDGMDGMSMPDDDLTDDEDGEQDT
jgi:membrane fusion protein, copper/silver efflux system